MNFNVTTDKEVLTLKNQTHELKCFAKKIFLTDRMASFKEYITDHSCKGNTDHFLCYDESQVTAVSNVVRAFYGMDILT